MATMAKRLSKPALFRKLGYEPHAGQKLVHESTAPRRVLACGSRWGKTTAGAYEAIAAALQPGEQTLGWICAPTYDLADRIYRLVVATVRERLPHRVVEINEREKCFKIANLGGGLSEVRCKSADNPVSLLGEALDWLIVDEATKMPSNVWERNLSQRLVDRNGWALLLSTPRGLNWFYRLYKLGQKNRDPDVASWRSPTWDNPHIPAKSVEDERRRLTEDAFDEMFGAMFLGEEDDPCDRCGCPSETAPGNVIVWNDEEIPTCPECGDLVDERGATLVRTMPGWGRGELSIIRIGTEECRPELPFELEEAK